MSEPTSLIMLFSYELGKSVVIAMPRISTALASRPCFLTKSSLARIAAPAPSEVGQHWSLVSGPKTIGAFRMSSSVYSSWNWRVGVVDRVLVVLPADLGEVLGRGAVALHVLDGRRCRTSAARPAPCSKPRSLIITWTCLSIGTVRSVYFMPSEPFSIFSKPSAIAQSAMPPSTNCLAMNSAVEPVEQLLLTL